MIYIQGEKPRLSTNKLPILTDAFCALAACIEQCWDYKIIDDPKMAPAEITCLVGTVEFTNKYLQWHDYPIPEAIDLLLFDQFLGRKVKVEHSEDFKNRKKQYPVFVKPYSQIKAFTGTQITSSFDEHLVLQNFEGNLLVSEVIDIVSEYRIYINRKNIIGMKHYFGNPLVFPNSNKIQEIVQFSTRMLDNISFTLDIGVTVNGVNLIIECNDGWAIGNYGLDPDVYLNFCIDRWKQMTK